MIVLQFEIEMALFYSNYDAAPFYFSSGIQNSNFKKLIFYSFQKRGNHLFSGVYNDIKNRFSHYLSDYVDGLNGQVVAATIFIYFAALSGAVAFGGLTGK